MKKAYLFFLLILCIKAYAQDNKVPISDLYISSAPGLILADKSTNSVDKPTTPRALAISLVNLGQGGAIEVTPFWWFNRPHYTYDKFIQKKFVMLETFNISVANYKSDNTFTYAPGIRTELFRVYSKSAIKKLKDKEQELIDAALTLDKQKISKVKGELDSISLKGQFAVEIAGALLINSDGAPFKNLDLNKSGIWTNVRWDPSGFPLGMVGLSRYAWSNNQDSTGKTSKFLDFGAQVNYTTRKLMLSAEYVNRKDFTGNQHYLRLAIAGSYAVTDNIILVASTGKDLKAGNKLLTIFGINLGLDRSK